MRFDVLTLFPEIFQGYLTQSLLKLAIDRGLVEVRLADGGSGFIDASRLTPGDRRMAQQAYCAFNAGVPNAPECPVYAFCGVQPGASGTMGLVIPSETPK